MDAVKMQWVECPILADDGTALHPPSCSDDEDDDNIVDLLNRREGHCAALLSSPAAAVACTSWVVVCGGYTRGIVSAAPLVAPASRLPALQWSELPAVDEFECDGASLTTVDAVDCTARPSRHTTEAGTSMASTPCPQSRCAAPVAYLFGGFDSDVNLRNALYGITLRGGKAEDGAWAPTAITVTEVVTTGDVPTPRARHGAGGRDGRLYIFGGETDTAEQTSDLYVCDVHSGVWRSLEAPGSCPAPRLLSLSLVFVSPTTFVLYGGSHFVQGAVQSFRDVWSYHIDTEAWSEVVSEEAASESSSLPRSNGHAGGAVVLPCPAAAGDASLSGGGACCTCAVFVGGKNISEGDDRVKLVEFSALTGAARVRGEAAKPAKDTNSFPHWRYTPALVTTEEGLLLLAGQCRHAQVPSSFMLVF